MTTGGGLLEGIGSIRQRSRFLSPVWQLRCLVALKVSLTIACAGLIIIYWVDFLNRMLIPFSALVITLTVLIGAQYHLPGLIIFALDFITGGIFASIAILLSFYILRDAGRLSYYSIIFIWIYTFAVTLLDKTSKHALMVKFSIIFYAVAGIFNGPTTPHTMATVIYYIIVICLVLPSGIVVFCSCVIHPIFASHLIMPEVVETLRNFRNLQSLLAYHHVLRAATRSSNAPLSLVHQKEENWEAIGEIEDHLAKSIERIKAYLKDSQAEVWNQEDLKVLAKVVVEVEKLYWLLVGKRLSIARYHPSFSPLDTMPLLDQTMTEMIKYLDDLLTCLEKIHERSLRSLRTAPSCTWPTTEAILRARQDLHEEFKETTSKMWEATHEVPFSSAEMMDMAAILSSMQAIGRQTQLVATMLQDVKPTTLLDAYKKVPKAVFFTLVGGVKRLAFQELSFGLVDQFKKKQSLKKHLLEMIHSKRWRYPFRFAIVIAATLAITLYLIREHSKKLHITPTNQSYPLLTAILVIVPTQGSTISRGLHRVLGTILGVVVGFLFAWAVTHASGPNGSGRWLTMEFLLPSILFFGIIIQLIPGTGYAALLFNITIPLTSIGYFQSPVDHPPISAGDTRIIFIAVSSVWSIAAFCALSPIRSVTNLRLSLLNCLSTSGKAFTTLLECGLLHDSGTTQLSEEETKIVTESFSTLNTAIGIHHLLLLDTLFETFWERGLYNDYREAVLHTRNLIQKLILIQTMYDHGFDEAITKHAIVPLRAGIQFVLNPIAATVTKVSAQRDDFANRRATSRAIKIKHLPQTVKEKFTERRHRKQLSLEERRQREIRKRCKTCKDLKDCEVHRSHINATQSTSSDSNRSPGPEQSAPQQEVIRASPSREENNSGDGENSAKRIVQGKGHDDAVFVPDLKEPTCFEDLQENFNKVRSHFYRMGSLNDRTWTERAEYLRFFALLKAIGQFAQAWEDMRQTLLRLGLLRDTPEALVPREQQQDQIKESPPTSPPVIEAEQATQQAPVGAKPQALASPPADSVELQVLHPSAVQLQSLQAMVLAQQQDEVSIMSQENKGGVVA